MKTKKYFLVTIICGLLVFEGFSQHSISSEWLINSVGKSWDAVADQVVDEEGMVYLTGNFSSSFQLSNHSQELADTNSMFVVKASPDGSIVWMKNISASGYCYSGAVAINKLGEAFVCGNYLGEIQTRDLTLNSGDRKQAFLIKLGQNGEPEWGINLNGSFQCTQMHLTTSLAGDVYFACSFKGKLVVGEKVFDSRYYSDIYIAGYDKLGKLVHSTILYGADDDIVNDITETTGGKIVITGSFEKELIAGSNKLISNGQKDILLVEMDENLCITSAQQFGGVYNDSGRELGFDESGNMVLAGTYTGLLEFDKSNRIESQGTSDVFLSKFDRDEHCLWSTSFGSQGSDYVSGIGTNTMGDIYLIGTFRGEIRIDDQAISSASFANDVFLVKFDAAGQYRFLEQLGSENHDFGKTIGIDAKNNLYISGNFSGQMKFLEDRTLQTENDAAFISRLHDCEVAPGITLPADTVLCGTDFIITVNDDFETYYWNGIAGNNEFTADSSGQIILEAIDAFGCYSSDTMNLVLNQPPMITLPDTIRVQQGEILTLEAPEGMQEYVWSDGSNLPFLEVNTALMQSTLADVWVQMTDEHGCVWVEVTCLNAQTFKNQISTDDFVGVLDDEAKDGITLYPNPADDKVFIKFDEKYNGEIAIDISNQNGKILFCRIVDVRQDHLVEVNSSGYPSGTYYIRISHKNKISYHKSIIY